MEVGELGLAAPELLALLRQILFCLLEVARPGLDRAFELGEAATRLSCRRTPARLRLLEAAGRGLQLGLATTELGLLRLVEEVEAVRRVEAAR